MKTNLLCAAALGLFLTGAVYAAPPADAPAGTTGLCKDGTYSNAAAKKGSCKGHKGVKEWYAADAAPAAKAAAPAAKTAAPAAAATTAATAAPAATPAPAKAAKTMPAPAANAAPGGGPGMVWANDSTKVYHCPGDKWYGKTKKGEYMSEADAKAKGMHGDHGKACAAK
ncbi:MAG: DUF3761 domain-containing protein [Burkholderiales bacterium]|nr:DUF3761 domain-containing protein [Burkholderiales bacterium]